MKPFVFLSAICMILAGVAGLAPTTSAAATPVDTVAPGTGFTVSYYSSDPGGDLSITCNGQPIPGLIQMVFEGYFTCKISGTWVTCPGPVILRRVGNGSLVYQMNVAPC